MNTPTNAIDDEGSSPSSVCESADACSERLVELNIAVGSASHPDETKQYEFAAADYEAEGCYTYEAGRDLHRHGFFGENGTRAQMTDENLAAGSAGGCGGRRADTADGCVGIWLIGECRELGDEDGQHVPSGAVEAVKHLGHLPGVRGSKGAE